MRDSVFLLRCVDCDARGLLSQLWLRRSLDVMRGGRAHQHHYVECLNCGAHLKSRQRDVMETVDDEEWLRQVGPPLAEESSEGRTRAH